MMRRPLSTTTIAAMRAVIPPSSPLPLTPPQAVVAPTTCVLAKSRRSFSDHGSSDSGRRSFASRDGHRDVKHRHYDDRRSQSSQSSKHRRDSKHHRNGRQSHRGSDFHGNQNNNNHASMDPHNSAGAPALQIYEGGDKRRQLEDATLRTLEILGQPSRSPFVSYSLEPALAEHDGADAATGAAADAALDGSEGAVSAPQANNDSEATPPPSPAKAQWELDAELDERLARAASASTAVGGSHMAATTAATPPATTTMELVAKKSEPIVREQQQFATVSGHGVTMYMDPTAIAAGARRGVADREALQSHPQSSSAEFGAENSNADDVTASPGSSDSENASGVAPRTRDGYLMAPAPLSAAYFEDQTSVHSQSAKKSSSSTSSSKYATPSSFRSSSSSASTQHVDDLAVLQPPPVTAAPATLPALQHVAVSSFIERLLEPRFNIDKSVHVGPGESQLRRLGTLETTYMSVMQPQMLFSASSIGNRTVGDHTSGSSSTPANESNNGSCDTTRVEDTAAAEKEKIKYGSFGSMSLLPHFASVEFVKSSHRAGLNLSMTLWSGEGGYRSADESQRLRGIGTNRHEMSAGSPSSNSALSTPLQKSRFITGQLPIATILMTGGNDSEVGAPTGAPGAHRAKASGHDVYSSSIGERMDALISRIRSSSHSAGSIVSGAPASASRSGGRTSVDAKLAQRQLELQSASSKGYGKQIVTALDLHRMEMQDRCPIAEVPAEIAVFFETSAVNGLSKSIAELSQSRHDAVSATSSHERSSLSFSHRDADAATCDDGDSAHQPSSSNWQLFSVTQANSEEMSRVKAELLSKHRFVGQVPGTTSAEFERRSALSISSLRSDGGLTATSTGGLMQFAFWRSEEDTVLAHSERARWKEMELIAREAIADAADTQNTRLSSEVDALGTGQVHDDSEGMNASAETETELQSATDDGASDDAYFFGEDDSSVPVSQSTTAETEKATSIRSANLAANEEGTADGNSHQSLEGRVAEAASYQMTTDAALQLQQPTAMPLLVPIVPQWAVESIIAEFGSNVCQHVMSALSTASTSTSASASASSSSQMSSSAGRQASATSASTSTFPDPLLRAVPWGCIAKNATSSPVDAATPFEIHTARPKVFKRYRTTPWEHRLGAPFVGESGVGADGQPVVALKVEVRQGGRVRGGGVYWFSPVVY